MTPDIYPLAARSDLADVALRCMCTLLTGNTHFNFRVNLMTCIVTRLSKKSWDQVCPRLYVLIAYPQVCKTQQSSELCLQTLSTVFRADLTGMASLEIVRLLNRMIKDQHFKVHPNVLSCFLHLRLRTELGVRSSDTLADKPDTQKQKRVKGKQAAPVHLSKKAKKALKEQKEINKELREAEAEVDKEERKTTVRVY
jgi:nucleolar complex protein 3